MDYQMPLFRPEGKWIPTPVSALPSWKGAKRIGIDSETKDPRITDLGPGVRRDGKIAGVSFAIEDGPDFYLPVAHLGGDNLSSQDVFSYLQDQAKDFDGDIGGMNLGYDLDFLNEANVYFPKVKFFRDVQIADPLIDELQNSYALQAIAERWGLPGKDETELRNAALMAGIKEKDIKKCLWQLPARYVAAYACHDARLPLQILRKQEKVIEEQGLWDIYNLESRVLPVLVKMRRKGVRIDMDKLEGVERWSLYEETEALKKVQDLTGICIPIGGVWKAKLLAPVLTHIGIKVGTTAKGAPNIDKVVLDNIDHPAAEALLWARKTNKLRTTFAQSIRDHMVKGRIHCVFNQLAREDEDGHGVKGARYGRLSSEHPNMQQQPARDEFAKRWRSIYVPEEGAEWASMDYSQQEPRVLTHYAVLSNCTKAEAAAKKYREDPNTDNHQMMADLTGLKRSYAKIVYLGLCYGMGGAKLSRDLKLPTKTMTHRHSGRVMEVAGDEAQEILDKFNSEAPFVRELAKRCEEVAQQRGYIITVGGRRCRFPKDNLGNFDWCHKALNRLIQGSSADQTKKAMVDADAAGHMLQLQVHDELDTSVAGERQANEIAEIMRTCTPLQVPSKVDVEIGPSWGEVE
jgi:DNA polymerase I-like protein with 3'-5' exonuclease and polymerase domains